MKKSAGTELSADQLFLTCEHAGNRIPRVCGGVSRRRRRACFTSRLGSGSAGCRAIAGQEIQRCPARRRLEPVAGRVESLADEPAHLVHVHGRALGVGARADPGTILVAAPPRGGDRGARRRAQGRRVVHIAVHSFTDVLDDQVRNADIGLLYDPARPGERALCKRWEQILRELDPALRVRRNYPYRGNADGLATWLRREFPDASYVGVELELNQALLASPRCRPMKLVLAASIARLLAESAS